MNCNIAKNLHGFVGGPCSGKSGHNLFRANAISCWSADMGNVKEWIRETDDVTANCLHSEERVHINKFNCPGKIQLLPERLGSGNIKTVFHEILADHPGPGELCEDCVQGEVLQPWFVLSRSWNKKSVIQTSSGEHFWFYRKNPVVTKKSDFVYCGQGSHSEHPYDVLVKILQKQKPLSYQCWGCWVRLHKIEKYFLFMIFLSYGWFDGLLQSNRDQFCSKNWRPLDLVLWTHWASPFAYIPKPPMIHLFWRQIFCSNDRKSKFVREHLQVVINKHV